MHRRSIGEDAVYMGSAGCLAWWRKLARGVDFSLAGVLGKLNIADMTDDSWPISDYVGNADIKIL